MVAWAPTDFPLCFVVQPEVGIRHTYGAENRYLNVLEVLSAALSRLHSILPGVVWTRES